jgi:hypothetical protein
MVDTIQAAEKKDEEKPVTPAETKDNESNKDETEESKKEEDESKKEDEDSKKEESQETKKGQINNVPIHSGYTEWLTLYRQDRGCFILVHLF